MKNVNRIKITATNDIKKTLFFIMQVLKNNGDPSRRLKSPVIENSSNHVGIARTLRSGKKFVCKVLYTRSGEIEISSSPISSIYNNNMNNIDVINLIGEVLTLGTKIDKPKNSENNIVLTKFRLSEDGETNIEEFNDNIVNFFNNFKNFPKTQQAVLSNWEIFKSNKPSFMQYKRLFKGGKKKNFIYSMKVSENNLELYSKKGIEKIPTMMVVDDITYLNAYELDE